LIIHQPDDEEMRKQWRAIKQEISLVKPVFHDHKGPDFRAKDGKEIASMEAPRLAFLLCQIKSRDDCGAVLTVGGKINGIAVALLAIAREKGRIILADGRAASTAALL
jgi:hypothetical protein